MIKKTLLSLCLLLSFRFADAQVNTTDSLALVDFFNSTNGPGWSNNTNWLTTEPVSNWFGVNTDANGRVNKLDLSRNQLSGSIPSSIDYLSNLQTLDLSQNQMVGYIPSSLGNLSNLQTLDLSYNQIGGVIPSSLGNLTSLQVLNLTFCGLLGSIPYSLGNLTSLQVLRLGYNGLGNDFFNGGYYNIPSSLSNLTNLQQLDLSNNLFSGVIPSFLSNFTNLQEIDLSHNLLNDSIPSGLGNLMNLQYLVLSFNRISGSIPSSLGNLKKLQNLDLSLNQLSENIPTSLGNITSLQQILLGANKISGSIPSSLGNLTNLVTLDLDQNQLSGSIPNSLGNLNLFSMFLNNNQLTGSIPSGFGNMTNLIYCDLSNNQLSGSIPSGFVNLTNLANLFLYSNKYTFDLSYYLSNGIWFAYAPQANIPLHSLSGNQLAVSAGGTLSQNTYNWYNADNNQLVVTKTGDSTFTPTTAGSYYVQVTNSVFTALTLLSDTVSFVPLSLPNFTWTGQVSSDWSVAGNWSNNLIPNSTDSITIPTGTPNNPMLSTNTTVGPMTLNGTLSLNGKALTFTGKVGGTGSLSASGQSSIIVNGNVGSLLFDATNHSLANLTIQNGSATLGNALDITGILSPTGGTFNTGGFLTLKSTSITNTAVVAPVTGTISGKVTVERFIPQNLRVYRDLAACVANAGSINKNWQEAGNNANGYGIQITGTVGASTGTDGTSGLDYTQTGHHSMFIYKDNVWDSISNTLNTQLDPYQGYRALVRGNRAVNLFQYPQPLAMLTPATIRSTGDLVTGQVTFTTSGITGKYNSSYHLTSGDSAFTFVANPYVCPIDWHTVVSKSTGITPSFWYADPTFLANDGLMTYVSYNKVSATSSNPLGSNLNQYIQPGQAFFVQNGSGSTPQMVIKETDKAASSTKTFIFSAPAPVNRIAIGLNNARGNVDGAVAVFSPTFNKSIGSEDSYKFDNGHENVSLVDNGDLCIDGRPMPTTKDILPIHLYGLKANTAYTLLFDATQFVGNGVAAFVKDNTNGKLSVLAGNTTSIAISTGNNPTAFSKRYSIVFSPVALPISGIAMTATCSGSHIGLSWSVVGSGAASYSIERGTANGFVALATVDANTFVYVDASPAQGVNSYRVKATAKDGSIIYSPVASANFGGATVAKLTVSPNPVVGGNIRLKMEGAAAGNYLLRILDATGKLVYSNKLNHGPSTFETLTLPKSLAAGIYTIKAISDNNTLQAQLEVK